LAERPDRIVLAAPQRAAGVRLDRFLATAPDVGTRSQAKQLIDAGRVRVDGELRKTAYTLRGGERVEVELPPPESLGVVPEAIPLVVLHEDDAVIAIDKPAGMVVHPAPGSRRGTLVHALAHRFGVDPVGPPERSGIVHRLDRDTSGVLLVARTHAALEALARQFRERTIEKRYVAVVRGNVARDSGTIDRPIGRHPRERKRMSVRSRRGRPSVTRWSVVERLRRATVVRLAPETGRTHQLRVHLAAIGHPIVGDRVYGARRGGDPEFPRQALHAEQITFAHPSTGARLTIRAPVPPDMQQLIETLRQPGRRTGESPYSA
jgi:23S rRNA pseudouridine1911/1915/1917 synthase